jgi:hypothetical protein
MWENNSLFILSFGWDQKRIFIEYGTSLNVGALSQDFAVHPINITRFRHYPYVLKGSKEYHKIKLYPCIEREKFEILTRLSKREGCGHVIYSRIIKHRLYTLSEHVTFINCCATLI